MELKKILEEIAGNELLHAKWLNTLSFMENAGARKISAAEHKTEVDLIILKHAAEEHRHAYYLKKQIGKINPGFCKTYQNNELLVPAQTRFYLHQLDIATCRYLKKHFNLPMSEIKFAAYLFVTYAIELRADELYPVYQLVLDESGSKVNVKSIILEEEGHLEEMIAQLKRFSPEWEKYAADIVALENKIFKEWTIALKGVLQPA